MPLADINTLLNTMIADIKADQPTLKTVEIYGGQFNGPNAKKFGFKTPAVFIAPLGGPPSNHPDPKAVEIDWRFTAFIVAKGDRGNNNHSTEALTLTQGLAALVKNNRWNTQDVRKAELTRMEWVDSLDSATIWAIQWTQPLYLACK